MWGYRRHTPSVCSTSWTASLPALFGPGRSAQRVLFETRNRKGRTLRIHHQWVARTRLAAAQSRVPPCFGVQRLSQAPEQGYRQCSGHHVDAVVLFSRVGMPSAKKARNFLQCARAGDALLGKLAQRVRPVLGQRRPVSPLPRPLQAYRRRGPMAPCARCMLRIRGADGGSGAATRGRGVHVACRGAMLRSAPVRTRYNAATAPCVPVPATLIAERGEGCCSTRTRAEFSAQSSADGHASMTTSLDAQHSATRRSGRPIYLPGKARKTAEFR